MKPCDFFLVIGPQVGYNNNFPIENYLLPRAILSKLNQEYTFMSNIVIDEFDSFIDDTQRKYEIIRPVLLKQTTAKERASQLKLHKNTLSKYITRFKEHGILGLADQRHGPKESNQWLTIEMKAEAFSLYNANPHFSYREIARIISVKYNRNVDYKSIQRVIDEGLSFLQHQKKFWREKKNTTFAGSNIIMNIHQS